MTELDPTTFRPETRALHSGQKPDSVHERTSSPDLRHDQLRLRRRGTCRPAVRAPGIRQHLHPDHEPDDRCLRAARRCAGRRSRCPRRRVRAGRRDADDPQPGPRRRQHRVVVEPLWRNVQPVHPHAAQDRHHDDICRRLRSIGVRASHQRQDEGRLPRTHRQPTARRPRPRLDRRRGPCPWRAGHRRQHLRAAHRPPDQAWRRHRHPLGHQVDRRSRDRDRRRGRRRGTFDWTASERFKQDFVDPDPIVSRRQLHGAPSATWRSSSSCASRACATSAPHSARSTPSCSCRASRRCRCGSRATARTRWRWRSGWRLAPR